jgi:YggT family protein
MSFIQSLIIYFLSPLLSVLFWVFVAYMIFSWLIAFNIINMRNHSTVRIYNLIRKICDPILDPIRKIVPPFRWLGYGIFSYCFRIELGTRLFSTTIIYNFCLIKNYRLSLNNLHNHFSLSLLPKP